MGRLSSRRRRWRGRGRGRCTKRLQHPDTRSVLLLDPRAAVLSGSAGTAHHSVHGCNHHGNVDEKKQTRSVRTKELNRVLAACAQAGHADINCRNATADICGEPTRGRSMPRPVSRRRRRE